MTFYIQLEFLDKGKLIMDF